MGVKRPLRPHIVAQYGEEIAQAEKLAKQGFDPKTGKLNEKIYGPTTIAFNPFKDLEDFKANGLIDDSFLQQTKESEMSGNDFINSALEAVKVEDPNFPMPSQEVQSQTVVNKQPEATPSEATQIPEDPDKKLEWVANQLAGIKPGSPNAAVLKEWKRLHGNVFILQIDDVIFIYRYLKRQEWAQLQANEAFYKMRPDQQEDHITDRCLLWPRLDPVAKGTLPAGAATMLAEQIKMQSMFLDPVQVANITIKL
jgi:hypothetical protein